jgi:hypothetical protein
MIFPVSKLTNAGDASGIVKYWQQRYRENQPAMAMGDSPLTNQDLNSRA